MKMIFMLVATVVILSSCSGVRQLQKGEQLYTEPATLTLEKQEGDNPIVDVDYTLVIPANYAKAGNAQVIYQPQFLNVSNSYDLQPVVINNKRTARIERRMTKRGYELIEPEAIRVVTGKEPISVNYDLDIPFQDWMPESELVGWTMIKLCNYDELAYRRQVIAAGVTVNDTSNPVYVDVTKDVLKPMRESESIYFVINGDKIDGEIGYNAKSIAAVKELISGTEDNENMVLKAIHIVGSASPDGTAAINDRLSKSRAEVVANMLQSEFNISPDIIDITSTGANWEDFKSLINSSSIEGKANIIAIADSNKSDWEKTLELRELPNYDIIKSDILPSLRNVHCTVEYKVIDKVVEKVKADEFVIAY